MSVGPRARLRTGGSRSLQGGFPGENREDSRASVGHRRRIQEEHMEGAQTQEPPYERQLVEHKEKQVSPQLQLGFVVFF